MVIFDFDKTLINKDTLFGFYRCVHGDNMLFKVKRVLLIFAAILYKLKFIDNDKLKSFGIGLFLKGKSLKEISKLSAVYADSLQLNKIYYDVFLKIPKNERIIISASPEVYLAKVFPDEKVIGTTFKYKNGFLKGLEFNCYGKRKLEKLFLLYPDVYINKVYSDSMSDKPLFEKSKKYYIIKNGILI